MKGDSEEEQRNGYNIAIGYYNKALLGLKMLFGDNKITDPKEAARFIQQVELPVCLNLALCYLKTD